MVALTPEAHGQIFSPVQPDWLSDLPENTKTVALGDVDGDGDLDLVCAGSFKTTLYANEFPAGGAFTQIWELDPAENTNSIALGDVDGDGDLDLVCGNTGTYSYVYWNEWAAGGFFSTTDPWHSDTMLQVQKVVLGDIDGNGYLDLVFSNLLFDNTIFMNMEGIPNTYARLHGALYNNHWGIALGDVNGNGDPDLVQATNGSDVLFLNDGGFFAGVPVWESLQGNHRSVDLGDVNGDGLLDLVCGDISGIELYWNWNGGDFFPVQPDWFSISADMKPPVALGDVDGDGDLDLVCGHEGEGTTLYLNEGGIFADTPAWSAGTLYTPSALALGDVNGDGHLDLVCGYSNHSNTLYLNLSDVFPDSSSYAGPQNSTYSTACGDVDGDGDLDLVCGNNGFNTLYLNAGGVIDTIPAWSSNQEYSTRSVVLADVDGDEDLDLICGNSGQSNTLYRNTGFPDYFSTGNPDWSSPSGNFTQSIAVGDVNGDGNLDLVCGNSGQRNTLFLNDGYVFADTVAWESVDARGTQGVALGDLDGDGYLDLVFGNNNQENTLYRNDRGSFSQDWDSDDANPTYAVALGDVNGDGRLDLVFGNSGLDNTVYLNVAGQFQTAPSWSLAPGSLTLAIALRDVDGDGTLDLISGNGNQANTVHLNESGFFAEPPAWSSPAEKITRSISVGDVDGDGDLDLLCGNFNETNTIYTGTRNPAFRGDPTAPTHQLPNNSAFLRSVSVQPLNDNIYQFNMTAVDVDSDSVWILPRYQYEGEPNWITLDIVDHTETIGPLPTSPAGIEHQFAWDASLLPVDSRNVILRLQVISPPQTVGSIQHVASYHKEIGPLEIRRAQIATSVSEVSFPAVTLGDTVPEGFIISNLGNEDLVVYIIELPSAEMYLTGALSFVVTPGDTHNITVHLAPREELGIAGDILIFSNDPFTPTTSIPVITDIHALEVQTLALTEGPVVPLGDAVTVLVNPAAEVNIQRGALNHRPSGVGVPFSSIELTLTGVAFIGVIQGEAVTEAGLEYFIELENSGVYATDPPDTSQGNFFSLQVEAPDCLTTQPQPTSGLDYLEGRSIPVLVAIEEGVVFVQGNLYYRRGGVTDYTDVPIQDAEPLPVAVIPDSLVTARGIEYWVEVQTSTTTLTDPCLEPDIRPHSIPMRVADLSETTASPAHLYRMVSVPLDFGVDFTGTLEALLSDQQEFGPYDIVQWRCFRYQPDIEDYRELSDTNADAFRPVPGRAFWLICANENRIGTAPVTGYSVPTDGAYAITLAHGWNQIGNPFAFPVAWDSLLVDGIPMIAVDPPLEGPVRWTGSEYDSVYAKVLDPFSGYWVRNPDQADVMLLVPPREALSDVAQGAKADLVVQTDSGWRLTIVASCGGARDSGNHLGVVAGAREQWDRNDRCEPPPSPGRSVSLYFPHTTWERFPGFYTADLRGEEQVSSDDLWGCQWQFDVAKSFAAEEVGDEVTLEFHGLADIPVQTVVYLVDRHLERLINLRTRESYRFYSGEREFLQEEADARFYLLVGSEEYLASRTETLPSPPVQTSLYQNRPNPFNPATVIRYDLDQAGPVSLRVYDVSGALVKTLGAEHHEPGRYEVVWQGKDERGQRVATGVYFYRLDTPTGQSETRKMLLVQ